MYCPAHFQEDRLEVLLQLIERYPLATIISSAGSGLVADHVPLLYEPATGTHGKLIGHVARNNPLWRGSPEQEHLLVFQGPSSYISPNWYATKRESGKVVPTWNYAVVHVYATLTATQDLAGVPSLLDKLTKHHETTQAHPWQISDAPGEFTDGLLGNITGIEFAITRIHGKWKVSQNQPLANQQSVIAGLRALEGDAASNMASLVDQFANLEAK